MANAPKAPPKKAPPADDDRDRGPAPGAPQEGGQGQKKFNPLLIAIVLGAMIVGGAGAFVAMKALSGPSSPPAAQEAVSGAESEDAAPPEGGQPAEDGEPITAPSKTGRTGPASGGSHAAPAEGGAEGAPAAAAGPAIVKLEPFTTNLNSAGGRAFIKLSISLEVDGQAQADIVNSKMDDIRDAVIVMLMGVSADDISTPDGVVRLKNQLLRRINAILPEQLVRKINITDIAVQ
ncbi:MAG: flagellar basal body-associated FliL family protein [Deltaproteobacteria bacterium]|jgi:flagellar basal body-associated protein FliL|nr:flagellar basal body-associated FliL family protein [Deltaproteobacteria bacterium]